MTEQTEARRTATRTARIDADSGVVAWALAGVLIGTAASAMALSFQAHTDVAESRLGAGQLAWTYPIAVDGALVGLAVAMLVQARRGEPRLLSGTALLFFTLLSSTVNVTHIIDITTPGTPHPLIGVALGALLPLMVLALTEVLARVIFTPPRPLNQPADRTESGTADPADSLADRGGVAAADHDGSAPATQHDSATDRAADRSGSAAGDHDDSAPARPATQTLTHEPAHGGSATATHPGSPATQPATHALTQAPDHRDSTPATHAGSPTDQAASRPAIQAVPASGSRQRVASRTGGVPEDRLDEVNRRIDELLGSGLSQQRIADELSDQMGLSVTKSRVRRRAQSHDRRAKNEEVAA